MNIVHVLVIAYTVCGSSALSDSICMTFHKWKNNKFIGAQM